MSSGLSCANEETCNCRNSCFSPIHPDSRSCKSGENLSGKPIAHREVTFLFWWVFLKENPAPGRLVFSRNTYLKSIFLFRWVFWQARLASEKHYFTRNAHRKPFFLFRWVFLKENPAPGISGATGDRQKYRKVHRKLYNTNKKSRIPGAAAPPRGFYLTNFILIR